MYAALITALVSGGITVGLVILYRYERTRGVRFMRPARMWLDRAVEATVRSWNLRYPRATWRSVRQSVHFLFHQFLAAALALIARVERTVHRVMQLNKKSANRAVRAEKPDPHLAAIAEHKRAAGLSEEEKRKRRDDALRGE